MTPSEIEVAIANLENLLNSGASSVSVDGVTTVIDVDSARRRLKELKSQLAKCNGSTVSRPAFYSIDLSKG